MDQLKLRQGFRQEGIALEGDEETSYLHLIRVMTYNPFCPFRSEEDQRNG